VGVNVFSAAPPQERQMKSPQTRIGFASWRYEPWRGKFYPKSLAQKDELHYASRQVNTIEINGTFYSLMRPASFQEWYDQTPDDFAFAVKCPQYITHIRRLNNIEEPLANFYASGVLALNEKLGPFLWQFPPNFKLDLERFEKFLPKLPRDTDAAAEIAKDCGERMSGRTHVPKIKNRPLRHAVEIRHATFLTPDFIKLLRKNRIALVIADTAGMMPFAEDITADFLYLRLHGPEEAYPKGYTDSAIERWAKRIAAWRRGGEPRDAEKIASLKPPAKKFRDIFAYFDTDKKIYAPANALALTKLLSNR
jgi:uncharacterized protein YecE (DUF72 family)